jgi:hypothetical protein
MLYAGYEILTDNKEDGHTAYPLLFFMISIALGIIQLDAITHQLIGTKNHVTIGALVRRISNFHLAVAPKDYFLSLACDANRYLFPDFFRF